MGAGFGAPPGFDLEARKSGKSMSAGVEDPLRRQCAMEPEGKAARWEGCRTMLLKYLVSDVTSVLSVNFCTF